MFSNVAIIRLDYHWFYNAMIYECSIMQAYIKWLILQRLNLNHHLVGKFESSLCRSTSMFRNIEVANTMYIAAQAKLTNFQNNCKRFYYAYTGIGNSWTSRHQLSRCQMTLAANPTFNMMFSKLNIEFREKKKKL